MSITLKSIPIQYRSAVTVLTDQDDISHEVALYGCGATKHTDTATASQSSMRDAIWSYCEHIRKTEVITLLDIAYTSRTWEDINLIWDYWKAQREIESLICRKKPLTHPWDCVANLDMYDQGEQLISLLTGNMHDIHKKEEYPDVWEIVRFVIMFRVSELQALNSNMYNPKTKFYLIDEKQLIHRS